MELAKHPYFIGFAVAALMSCRGGGGLDTAECLTLSDTPPGYHKECSTTDECSGELECLSYPADYGHEAATEESSAIEVCS